jgi:hypothetical protein
MDDRFGSHITHFSASNNAGPGTLYETLPDGSLGVFYGRQALNQPPFNFPPGAANVNPEAQCSNKDASSLLASVNASLATNAVKGISADLNAAVNQANSITVDPMTFAVEDLQLGPFQQWVNDLPAGNLYKQDVSKKGFLLLYRAVRVNGLHATLTYSQDNTFDVSGKFSPSGAGTIASASAGFKAEAKDNKTLEITATSPFYIAGELVTFSGPAGAGPAIIPLVPTVDNSKERHP